MKLLPALAALLLAACGQTGPLRLPEPEAPPTAVPAEEAPKTSPSP